MTGVDAQWIQLFSLAHQQQPLKRKFILKFAASPKSRPGGRGLKFSTHHCCRLKVWKPTDLQQAPLSSTHTHAVYARVLSENPAPHSLVTRLCALRRWVYIPGPGKVCGFSLHYWRNENDEEIDGSFSPTCQRNTSSLSV